MKTATRRGVDSVCEWQGERLGGRAHGCPDRVGDTRYRVDPVGGPAQR